MEEYQDGMVKVFYSTFNLRPALVTISDSGKTVGAMMSMIVPQIERLQWTLCC